MGKKGTWKRVVALALALVTVLSTNGISVMASAVNLAEAFGLSGASENVVNTANVTDASAEDADAGTETVSYTATSGVAASAVTVDDETDTADGAETPSYEVTSETTIAAAEGEGDGAYADDVTTEEYEITVPQYASSSSEDTYLDFTYTIYNGEAYITGYIGEETDIVIPDEIVVESDSGTETYPVTFIGWYAFNNNCTLTSVELPDSVTTIEEGAFSYCTALTEIILSDGVTTINNNAFSYCTALTEIVIPGSASCFGDAIFYGCSSLESAVLCEGVASVGSYMFGLCSSLTTIELPESVTSIENGAFWNCISLAEVTLPDSLEGLGNYAFSNCTSLAEVTLPDSLESLGDYAFSSCTTLEEITISGSVSTFGKSVFSRCSALTKITISDGVTSIGANAFYECSALTEVNLPEGIESVGSKAFGYCSNLESIIIPESVTSLDTYAFYYCTSLTKITIPESITSLSKGMFQGCTALTEVNLPDALTMIGDEVFRQCTSLVEILIPDSVKTIGSSAFSGCGNLTEIYLPTNLESIGDDAFYWCTSLTEIMIPGSVTNFGDYIFSGCSSLESAILCEGVTTVGYAMFDYCSSLTTIELPESMSSIGNYAFFCCTSLAEVNLPDSLESLGVCAFGETAIEEIIIPGSVTNIGSNVFFRCENLEMAVLCDGVSSVSNSMFSNCTSLKETTIPETVTEIGEYAFTDCSSLAQITLPGGVTDLETGTFYNCIALTGVNLPENLSSIGDEAFYGCSSLTEMTIPETVTEIGECAFSYCSALEQITLPDAVTDLRYGTFSDCSALTGVDLPENLSGIGDAAFYGCSLLTELTIPETVTEIGECAFSYCSALEQITLPDAVTDLRYGTFSDCIALTGVDLPENLSSIGDEAFYGCSSLTEMTIPETVTEIGEYAFEDCDQIVLCVYPGSYAYEYAVSNSLAYKLFSDCTLTVDFDGIDGWSDYTGTLLVATSGSLKVSKRISAATSYVLTGLASGDECTVAVTNASGNVIASQTVELAKGENAVTFTELAAIADVCAHVYDADGNEVTDKVTMTWTEDGATYATGGSLAAVPVGTVLSCEVRLGKSLGLQYETPDAVTCTVTEEGTEITVALNTFSKITLTGTVLDESGEAISGAAVEMVQQLNGYSSSATALTGSDGSFTVTVCDADTQITVTAGGYRTVETELSAPSGNTDLGTVTLEKLAGPKISLQVTYQYAAKSEATASAIILYSFDDVAFTIENQTTGSQVSEYSLSGQTLVLGDDAASAGDELEITLTSRSGDFDPVSVTVTVGDDEKASATAALTQRGSISATWTSVEDGTTGDGTVVGFVYDNTGKQVYKVTSSALKFDSGVLPAGTYTVILAGYSEDFVYPQSLSAWQSSGLTSWTDYLEETVTVSDGVVTELSFDEVPAFDAESFSYLDMTQSSFTSSKTSVTTGTYVTLRATAVLKEEYAEQASDFRWILELPENGSFLPGTLSISGQNNAEVYAEDNILEISVDDPSAVTRFCVLLTEAGQANAAAYLEFTIDGVTYRQAVGTLAVTCTELDFTMPERTCLTTVPVSGTGVRGATVRLYDNDTLVGQTEISVSGAWSMTFDLYKPYTYTTHRIYAEITTKDGLTYRTETKKLIYQYGAILVSKVTMVNYGHEEFQTVFTFDGSQLGQSVSYDYNPDYPEFTFLIEFEGEDLSVLSNVQLTVACSNGESETLEAAYDETQGCYVATTEFYSSALPTGVTVWYDADQELILSDEEVADETAEWEEIAELLEELEGISLVYDEETFAAVDFSDDEEAAAAQAAIITSMRDFQAAVDSYESAAASVMGDVTWTETGYTITNDSFSVECSTGVDIASIDISGYTEYATTNGDTVYVTGDGTESSPLEIVTADAQMTMSLAEGATATSMAETMSNIGNLLSATVLNPFTDAFGNLLGSFETIDKLYDKIKDKSTEATTVAEKAKYEKKLAALEEFKNLGEKVKIASKVMSKAIKVGEIVVNAAEALGRWSDIGELVKGAGCSARSNAGTLRAEAVGMAIGKVALGLTTGAVAGMIIAGIFTGGASLLACVGAVAVVAASTGLNIWAGKVMDKKYDEDKKKLEEEAANSAGGCDCGQSGCKCGCNCVVCPDGSTAGGKTKPGFNAISDNSSKGMIDPSGYVYEAVLSNRLEGVTTTIYQKETLYDMYDEPYEQITLWDAAEYGQENPLSTNSEGEYAWDVPEGLWRVVYEKEGYVTEQSDWMEVPPPQLDVNVGLVSYEAPVLEKVLAYTGSVEITFSKYMQTETLTAENITVKVNGMAVEGTFEMTNEEENPEDETETFTSVVIFIPNQAISEGATVTVEVSEAAASYAGTAFAGEAVSAETVLQPESITAEGTVSVVSGESIEVTIQALPAEAVAGITVTVANQTSLLFTVEETEVTLDAEGKATVHVTGCIAGESVIIFTLGDTDLTAETVVSVSMATPSITRSEVAAGNIDASLITAIAGSRDAEQISFTGSYDLSDGLTLSAKSGITGDKALLLQEDDSADSGLALIDFCMIDSDGNITFSVEDAVDSVIVYGTNGDVTGDGVVNASDTLAILRGVSGRTTLDAVKEGFADVNLDGVVNSNDLLAVVKYVSGRTSSLY